MPKNKSCKSPAYLKILMLIDNLGSGGAQNQLSYLACELSKQKHEIVLITYYPQDFFVQRIERSNITHIKLKKNDRIGLDIILKLKSIIRKGRFDVLLSFLDTPNFYLSLARVLSSKKLPIIISYRSQTQFDKLCWLELSLKKWMNSHATIIVSNSYHEKKAWVSRFPKLREKFFTIYNSVDLSRFKAPLSKEKHCPFRILCVGSVCADKNGMLVIQALDHIVNELKIIDIQLTWVGEKQRAIKSRNAYIQLMEKTIDECNLSGYWIWKNPVNEINEVFLDNDVLVHASSREGLPNVVCEALSCGLPVVLSNILDHPILANGNKNGLLFNPSVSQNLSSAILKMRSTKNNQYQSFSINARDFAETHFGLNRFIESYNYIFRKALELSSTNNN